MRKRLAYLLLLLVTLFLGGYNLIRPNGWNTIYYEANPTVSFKNVPDSLKAKGVYKCPLVAHTFFERGSGPFKKYRHGDTVAVLHKGKVVAEFTIENFAGPTGTLWSKINEIVPDTVR